MKKILSWICVLSLILGAVVIAPIETKAADKEATATYGDLSDTTGLNAYKLSVLEGSRYKDASFLIQWTEGALYITVTYTLNDGETFADTDMQDAVRFIFDFDGKETGDVAVPINGDAMEGVYWINRENWTAGSVEDPQCYDGRSQNYRDVMGDSSNPEAGCIRETITDGNTVTVKTKWVPTTDELKAIIQNGNTIGLDVQVQHFGNNSMMAWADTDTDWTNDMRQLGEVTLEAQQTGNEGTEAEEITGTVGKKATIGKGDLSDTTGLKSYKLSVLEGNRYKDASFVMQWMDGALYITVTYTLNDGETFADTDMQDAVRFIFDFDGKETGDVAVPINGDAMEGVYWINRENWTAGSQEDPQCFDGRSQNYRDIMGDSTNPEAGCIRETITDGNTVTVKTKWVPTTDELKAIIRNGNTIGLDVQVQHFGNNSMMAWADTDTDWTNDMRQLGTVTFASEEIKNTGDEIYLLIPMIVCMGTVVLMVGISKKRRSIQ